MVWIKWIIDQYFVQVSVFRLCGHTYGIYISDGCICVSVLPALYCSLLGSIFASSKSDSINLNTDGGFSSSHFHHDSPHSITIPWPLISVMLQQLTPRASYLTCNPNIIWRTCRDFSQINCRQYWYTTTFYLHKQPTNPNICIYIYLQWAIVYIFKLCARATDNI